MSNSAVLAIKHVQKWRQKLNIMLSASHSLFGGGGEYPKSMAERRCLKYLYIAFGTGSFVTIWDYTTNSIWAYSWYYAAPDFSHMEKV